LGVEIFAQAAEDGTATASAAEAPAESGREQKVNVLASAQADFRTNKYERVIEILSDRGGRIEPQAKSHEK
jgi:hypothetical protein